jgi:metallophosphoesterase (TIGR00282 family)
MDEATVARILFIGDVVGEAGVAAVERQLPLLRERHRPTFVVANGENADLTGPHPASGCGITPESAERLLAAGVDCLTGGNHSWDGQRAAETLSLQRVLRPLNYGAAAPGRGALVITRDGLRLGVVNVVSRTALPHADTPFDATAAVIDAWDAEDAVDLVLVDVHGDSVHEKQVLAWALAGRATAVLGTHTHVATCDTRILPPGTAYVSDVGMTGPSGGMQGYAPGIFVAAMRSRLPIRGTNRFADGPVEWGVVLITTAGRFAARIERVSPEASAGGGIA